MPSAPAGIVLPKPRHARDAVRLSEAMDVLENHHDIPRGQAKIIVLCTEHPEALFTLGSYVGRVPRLAGMSWGAEDLSAAVGAAANRDEQGSWLPPYELARSLCLFAAGAAEVAANAEDPLFILYTSGSTGKPKGVLHTTGGYLVYAAMTHQYVFDYHDGDIYWCTADVGWVTGHSYIVYGRWPTARPR